MHDIIKMVAQKITCEECGTEYEKERNTVGYGMGYCSREVEKIIEK